MSREDAADVQVKAAQGNSDGNKTDKDKSGWTDESIIRADAEKTYEEFRQRIGELKNDSSIAESNEILCDMAGAVGLDDMHREGLFIALVKRTGLGKKVLKASYARHVRERHNAEAGEVSSAGPAKALIAKLTASLGGPFKLPSNALGSFDLEKFDGRIWMFRRATTDEGEDRRLTTPFMLAGGINFADRGEDRGLRAVVQREDGTWRGCEIDPGLLAEGSKGALGPLRRAGLQMTSAGREFVSHYLMESQPKATTVYHRAGFRGAAFICPTGEVLLVPKGTVELAQDMWLKCAPRAGTLEGWREGARDLFDLGVEKAGEFQSGILMGLSGPVADLAGDDPLAFSLEGETSRGKSTTQEMAVTPWCNPSVHPEEGPNGEKKHGLFRAAKGSDNATEILLELGSGTVCALDEIGHLPAKVQQDLMFMNQAGSGKNRMKPDGTLRENHTWGGLALIVSAETGFAQRLNLDGVAQRGGLGARVSPVQVDSWPLLDMETEWPVVEAVKANFGHSGPAFIEALAKQGFVRDPDKLRQLVSEHVSQLPEINGGTQPAFRRRAARPLGYLWTAGKIAADAGLIPVKADLEGLMQRLWIGVLESEIGPKDPKTRAVVHLLDQLNSLRGSSIIYFPDRDDKQNREVVGYWGEIIKDPDDNGFACPIYVVRNDKLAELSGGFVDDGALRAELERMEILIRSRDGKSRTWSGFPGLGKGVQYVVLRASGIDA